MLQIYLVVIDRLRSIESPVSVCVVFFATTGSSPIILVCSVACFYDLSLDTVFLTYLCRNDRKKSMTLLPLCKLYPTLLALLSHTASSVANAG